MKIRLTLFEEGKDPQTIISDLTPGYKLVIGRGENAQLWVKDKNISRAHCQMTYDNQTNQLLVEDLESRNGTFVNGQLIGQKVKKSLNDGDDIRLASTCHLTISFTKPSVTSELQPPLRPPILARPGNHSITLADNSIKVRQQPQPQQQPQQVEPKLETIRMPTDFNLVGAEFSGYRMEEIIGIGEMAVVYRAVHLALKRVVAVKTLAPKWLSNTTAQKRFLNVSKVSGQLSHPNIVQIYDSGVYSLEKGEVRYQIPFLVMEHVHGQSLEYILKTEPYLTVQRAAKIIGYIAGALSYTGKKKIIHRDINPSNILVGPEDVPKLIGLGLAKCLDEDFITNVTQPGKGMGMVGYIAPEQLSDASKADHRADIYSLGAVFYRSLCGQPPYDTQNLREYFNCIHRQIPPVPPYELNNEVPRDISDLILKSLAYDPKDRYQTAEAFMEELRPYISPRSNQESFEKARKQIMAMLPSPQAIPGFEFESIYNPAEEIGGDFYDFFELNDHEFAFAIGDITGHGVEAAVVVGMVKAAIKIIGKQYPNTAETFMRVNKEIYPDLDTTTYATVSYGIIDRKTKVLRYSRAGHTPLIVFNPQRTPQITCHENQGMVLGMFSECKCQEVSIQLQSGDFLIQYTDGITEAMNNKQEEYGLQRLCEVIQKAGAEGNLKKILAAIQESVKNFSGNEQQQDDITIMGIRVS